jgi:hypothetical protein
MVAVVIIAMAMGISSVTAFQPTSVIVPCIAWLSENSNPSDIVVNQQQEQADEPRIGIHE